MLMIHNPWTMAVGNANELRKQADDLDQIAKASIATYLAKAGDKLDEGTLKELLDNETWLTAQEAVDYGLADEVIGANSAAASLNKKFVQRYRHVPKQLISEETPKPRISDERQRILKTSKAYAEALAEQLKNLKEAY